jgi:hypothetical protein
VLVASHMQAAARVQAAAAPATTAAPYWRHAPHRRSHHTCEQHHSRRCVAPRATSRYDLLALSNLCLDVVQEVPALPPKDDDARKELLAQVRNCGRGAHAFLQHMSAARSYQLCNRICPRR